MFPTCEGVAHWCLGLYFHGCKELAVEIGIGHLQTVDIDIGAFDVGCQLYIMFLYTGEFHGTGLLQTGY